MTMRPITLAALCALAVSGCARTRGGLPQAPLVPALEHASDLTPYRLQVGDALAIKFLLNPELNEQVVVRPDGMISTAVAQDVPAFNVTPTELGESLKAAYHDLLARPSISVVVQSIAPTRVYVAGEVADPGEMVTSGPALTLTQALARAGGVKASGADRSIFIIRRGAGDHPLLLATRYTDVIHAIDPDADVRLANFDVVYVPKTGIAEFYTAYNQYLQQFISISWGFSYFLNQAASNTVAPGAVSH
jgi:polysaccharide export outer membrane protein